MCFYERAGVCEKIKGFVSLSGHVLAVGSLSSPPAHSCALALNLDGA